MRLHFKRNVSVHIRGTKHLLKHVVRVFSVATMVCFSALAQTQDDPLLQAIESNNVQRIQKLLNKGANANAKNVHGDPALVVAAGKRFSEVVSILLVNGAAIDGRNRKGVTALMLAASQCNEDIVRQLWNAGADVFVQDPAGNTAQSYAVIGKCPAIIRAASANLCKDLSAIYGQEELKKEQSAYTQEVDAAKDRVEQELKNEGESFNRLHAAKIVTPLFKEECRQPFYAASIRSQNVIEIPIFTIKMLRDLMTADLWYSKHGFKPKSYLYVESLKYRRAADFPGKIYPRPFAAMELPEESAWNLEEAAEAKTLFLSALFFIVAHEAAHIVLNHSGSTSGNEMAADLWALDRIRKADVPLDGILFVLGFLGYWVPNRADFESELDYQIWLATKSAYPSTASRLILLSSDVLKAPWEFVSSAGVDSPSALEKVTRTASSMDLLSRSIDNDTINSQLFWDILAMDVSVLGRKEVTH